MKHNTPDLFDYQASRIKDPPCEYSDNGKNSPKGANLRKKTEDWIDHNPEIYSMFKKFALELVQKGRPFSISLITERVRWECNVAWQGDFKISNNYRAYIARKLAQDIPELGSVLRFKKTRW